MSEGAIQIEVPFVCLVVSVTANGSAWQEEQPWVKGKEEVEHHSAGSQETFWLPQKKSHLLWQEKYLEYILQRPAAAYSPWSQPSWPFNCAVSDTSM